MKLILSSLQKEQCQNRLYSSRWYSSSSTILLDTLVVALSALSIKKNYYRAGLNKMTAFLRLSHHQVIKFSCSYRVLIETFSFGIKSSSYHPLHPTALHSTLHYPLHPQRHPMHDCKKSF